MQGPVSGSFLRYKIEPLSCFLTKSTLWVPGLISLGERKHFSLILTAFHIPKYSSWVFPLLVPLLAWVWGELHVRTSDGQRRCHISLLVSQQRSASRTRSSVKLQWVHPQGDSALPTQRRVANVQSISYS